MSQKVAIQTVRCHILLTKTARAAMMEHVADEHTFFSLQKNFIVYIEKFAIEESSLALTLYFDNEKNRALKEKFAERVVIMDCAFDLKNGLIAKSFRTRGKGTPVATNRRARMLVQFVPSRISGHTYPEEWMKTIAALPVAKERFDYVNKRISSWEGYLKVLSKNADIEDIEAKFSTYHFSEDSTQVTFTCSSIADKQWKQLKGLSAAVRGFKQDIGDVVKAKRGEQTVEIALKPELVQLARKNALTFEKGSIEFSNAATKSQLRRLLKGFDRLKEGLSANPNLETILFEDQPQIAKRRHDIVLDFHNNLNEFQRSAVTGAMSAEDLYVIQGPPGTGKTTVISEICYQNAKAGLKTLVASQSNLAVDNALSRLLSNKEIRILRYGRTDSIEEEGKKFIEENVALYWQQQTYEAIAKEVAEQPKQQEKLQQQLETFNTQITQLQEETMSLQQQIEEKAQASEKLAVVEQDISQLKKQLIALKKERDHREEQLKTLEEKAAKLAEQQENARQALDQYPTAIEEQLKQCENRVDEVNEMLAIATLQKEQQELGMKWKNVKEQVASISNEDEAVTRLTQKITALKKVQDVEDFIELHDIRRSYVIDRLLASLGKLQQQIEVYKPIKTISERLEKALAYSQKTLHITVSPLPLQHHHQYSLAEIEEFLTKLSRAFAEQKINATNGTRSVQGILLRQAYIEQQYMKYQQVKEEVMLIFRKLKEELVDLYQEQMGQDAQKRAASEEMMHRLHAQLQEIERKLANAIFVEASSDVLEKERADLLKQKEQLLVDIATKEKWQEALTQKQSEYASVNETFTTEVAAMTALKEQIREVNSSGLELEERKQQLEQMTKQNPEQALAVTKEKIATTEKSIEKTAQMQELLPVTQQLQSEWQTMLETATPHDLDEIRKLYVKHANVIGTTCVASANKEFMDNYPTFDVVIIDEVSKATPPELLLPMLKGKKIILVGDHHQLPPLIGDETLEETLAQVMKESETFEEKRELEKLLEESLFERLYHVLPDSHKTMLAIQYRMHENIMQTIVPFYAHDQNELQCGLENSDVARDHGLETALFSRKHHLLWQDIPHEPAFFEERMKEGASLFNKAELEEVQRLLQMLNEATAQAIQNGRLREGEKKSVGVISFYAQQVKRINDFIGLHYPHLHIRTGSVDKFQGMEMDVIIVSMVRNHHGQGSIGFAQDYRRLNVALSRARELLIMVGSSEMFTKKPKKVQTRQMYQHVLDVAKAQDGYRKYGGEQIGATAATEAHN